MAAQAQTALLPGWKRQLCKRHGACNSTESNFPSVWMTKESIKEKREKALIRRDYIWAVWSRGKASVCSDVRKSSAMPGSNIINLLKRLWSILMSWNIILFSMTTDTSIIAPVKIWKLPEDFLKHGAKHPAQGCGKHGLDHRERTTGELLCLPFLRNCCEACCKIHLIWDLYGC